MIQQRKYCVVVACEPRTPFTDNAGIKVPSFFIVHQCERTNDLSVKGAGNAIVWQERDRAAPRGVRKVLCHIVGESPLKAGVPVYSYVGNVPDPVDYPSRQGEFLDDNIDPDDGLGVVLMDHYALVA